MELRTILLVISALVPAVALCIYTFKKDRAEKEPLWLLLLLLGAGVLTCFPAAEISGFLSDSVHSFFEAMGEEKNGAVYLSSGLYRLYHAVDNFGAVAFVEEGLKWIALLIFTVKSKNFNSLFDGMIYAIFVSLGFAGFENILYVLNYGWTTALLRAFTAVPGHLFDAVLMGYYYSMWHVTNKAKIQETDLKQKEIVPRNSKPFKSGHLLALSLIVPIMAHGFYDYACSVDTSLSTIIFYIFLAILYIYCFGKIRKFSKADMSDNSFAAIMVYHKYKN